VELLTNAKSHHPTIADIKTNQDPQFTCPIDAVSALAAEPPEFQVESLSDFLAREFAKTVRQSA
jgi:hypothetical protein